MAEIQTQLLAKAQALQAEDFTICHAIGDCGLESLPKSPEQLTLFTHCNHGALATSGYGTSLGVVRSAWREGRLKRVFAGETRPNLQGARLTAWECVQEKIPVTVVTDSMAAHCMQQGWIHAVFSGGQIASLLMAIPSIKLAPMAWPWPLKPTAFLFWWLLHFLLLTLV